MKKILIIAYYFPPLGGGGVQRPLKFCKYIPNFGFKPIVLTSKNGVGPVYDETLLDELNSYKDVKIYRTLSYELGGIKKLLFGQRAKGAGQRAKGKGQSVKREESLEFGVRISERKITVKINKLTKKIQIFLQKIYNALFLIIKKISIPDDKIYWTLPTLFSAIKIIKKENIDLIFITIPPNSSFILGILLKKFTGKKLVVDYRDPWNTPHTRRCLNYLLEKWGLKNCNGIVYAWPGISNILTDLFNNIFSSKKSALIYNGFDEDDYKNISSKNFNKFTIISGGELYDSKNIYFFKIVEELLMEHPEIRNNFQIIILSNYHKWFEDYLKKSTIKDNIISLGILPKKKYLSFVKGANLAVIFSHPKKNGNMAIHGRIFDYLYLKKKVLIIDFKESEIINLAKKVSNAEIYFAEQKKEIKQYLFTIIKNRNNNSELSIVNNKFNLFSRKAQTKNLATFFNNLN